MFNISKIRLTNFRSYHGRHVFEFPSDPGLYCLTGLNLVTPRLGANATGKSTLLDGIFWCLHGRTTRGLKAGDVVTRGERQCSVTVSLTIGNERFAIRRTQNPNSLTLHDAKGKHVIDQTSLQKRLRLTPEAFAYAVMLPQFGDSFFDLPPAAKLTLFSQIMELDFWLDKSHQADMRAKELADIRHNHEQIIARAEGQIDTIKHDVADLTVKEGDYAAEQKRATATIKIELQQHVSEKKHLEMELSYARAGLRQAEKRLASLTKRTNSICPTCKQEVHDTKTERDRKSLLANRDDFEHKAAQLERRLTTADDRINDLHNAIAREAKRTNPYGVMVRGKLQAKRDLKAKLTEEAKLLEATNEDHAAISFWVNGFKRLRLLIIEDTLRQLEIEVNNNLTSLGLVDWRVEFDVERENKAGGVTKGFVVLIHAPDYERPIRWESWSGGETQRLRLAGNLGLANLIMERAGLRSQVEFYDEPSQHLSQEGLLDLAETLDDRALRTGRCIWLVDHNLIDYGFAGKVTAIKDHNGSRLGL